MEMRYLFLLATILCLGQQAGAAQSQQPFLRKVTPSNGQGISGATLSIQAFMATSHSTEATMSDGAQVKLYSDNLFGGKYRTSLKELKI